jgi:hypothetical protein
VKVVSGPHYSFLAAIYDSLYFPASWLITVTMGALLSKLRLSVAALRTLAATYEELARRAERVAGLPVDNPSRPYWTIPLSPIAKEGAHDQLPYQADVVIIGTGITGTSIARALLRTERPSPIKVVMLEARDVCSGATAR